MRFLVFGGEVDRGAQCGLGQPIYLVEVFFLRFVGDEIDRFHPAQVAGQLIDRGLLGFNLDRSGQLPGILDLLQREFLAGALDVDLGQVAG